MVPVENHLNAKFVLIWNQMIQLNQFVIVKMLNLFVEVMDKLMKIRVNLLKQDIKKEMD